MFLDNIVRSGHAADGGGHLAQERIEGVHAENVHVFVIAIENLTIFSRPVDFVSRNGLFVD